MTKHITDCARIARHWLILADDLTGAADCAIAFGRIGREAVVTWGDAAKPSHRQAAVWAHDVASRGLSSEAAAARHLGVLARLPMSERALFKKIDSTLRGQPAAELAATLAHLKSAAERIFGVLAPAFPATGRTTVDGRVLVHGAALEETELWRRDHTYPNADLDDVLAAAGICGEKVTLAAVRGGDLGARFATMADRSATMVAICDAETENDLALIAEAGLHASPASVFIGSAGLAHALANLEGRGGSEALRIPASKFGTLTVVGSLAAASRVAARRLRETGAAAYFPVEPKALAGNDVDRAELASGVMARLANGVDALVEISLNDSPDMSVGPLLAHNLATALQVAAPVIGAIAATGGETAAALLSGLGVNAIRLADEIEPGVSLGLTLGALSVPVVTKAGAFGDADSLVRINARLHAVRTRGSFA
ncbi:four-carbon acid sugar kinase family protein [Bradyrhizobium sp. OAE829]|uniref:four-carbon acid sugar kinase family protein n=1 Tax=Bradyrhizobium sp. OAE829 TaxID=2663807 RepID=UPI0019F6DD2B